MTTKKTPNPGSAIVAANGNETLAELVNADVPANYEEHRVRRSNGTYAAKLNDDQIDWALIRLACGDSMRNVCHELKITEAALYYRCVNNPAFAEQFTIAIEIGEHARLEKAGLVARGVEGYSTGDKYRDKMVLDHAHWMAARRNRRVYGERGVQIAAQGITIQMPDDFSGKL